MARKLSDWLSNEEVLKYLWVIFVIEGACRASVPFGWLPRKAEWKARKISFLTIMREVAREIRREWAKWTRAVSKGEKRDFIRWLAEVGYNANPEEWRQWEKNFRQIVRVIERL